MTWCPYKKASGAQVLKDAGARIPETQSFFFEIWSRDPTTAPTQSSNIPVGALGGGQRRGSEMAPEMLSGSLAFSEPLYWSSPPALWLLLETPSRELGPSTCCLAGLEELLWGDVITDQLRCNSATFWNNFLFVWRIHRLWSPSSPYNMLYCSTMKVAEQAARPNVKNFSTEIRRTIFKMKICTM